MRNSTSTPPRLVSASSSSNGRKHKRLFDIFTASATTEVLTTAAVPLSQQSTSTTMDTISLSSEKNISHSPYKVYSSLY